MFTQILTIFLCSLFLAWRISFKISSSGPIETFQQKVPVQLSQVAFIWRLICYNFSLSGYICLVRNSCLKVHPCLYVTDVLPGLLDLIFSVEVGFHLEVVSLCQTSMAFFKIFCYCLFCSSLIMMFPGVTLFGLTCLFNFILSQMCSHMTDLGVS